MYLLVTTPVRLIGRSGNLVLLIYSRIPFLTCVFWALIQLNLAVNPWNGFALERSQWLAEGRHLATSRVSSAYFWEATANGEIILPWKLPGNTPMSSYVVVPASSTAVWMVGLLGQLRAPLCRWLPWQEGGVWKARKMEARANFWGEKTGSEEKCLKTWETLSRFRSDVLRRGSWSFQYVSWESLQAEGIFQLVK